MVSFVCVILFREGGGCARFSLVCTNSRALHNRIAMETFTPARCKTAKIRRNEHTAARRGGGWSTMDC